MKPLIDSLRTSLLEYEDINGKKDDYLYHINKSKENYLVIGNMLPVPFIFFLARKILVWGSHYKWPKVLSFVGKFMKWCLKKGEKGGKKLTEKAGRSTYVALLLFVGIPLPGTGAWTGTLAASILNLDFKKSSIACMCGVILAGLIMGILSIFVKGLFF